LLPRSSAGEGGPITESVATDIGISNKSIKNTNPFGLAKPREEVLQQRGVDPAEQNSRFDKKAERPRYTQDQQDEIDKIQNELTIIMTDRREANEMELPEETYRVAEDAKRKELNDVIEKFNQVNLIRTPTVSSGSTSARKINDSGTSKSSYRSLKKVGNVNSSSERFNSDDKGTTRSQFSNSSGRFENKPTNNRSNSYNNKSNSNSNSWRVGDTTGSSSFGSSTRPNSNSRRDRRYDDHSDNSFGNNSSNGGLGSDDDRHSASPPSFTSLGPNRRSFQRNTFRT
jgi:hypothetical protein